MSNGRSAAATALAAALVVLSILRLANADQPTSAAPTADPLGGFPLAFVPNTGQADAAVRFTAHGHNGEIAFAQEGVQLALPDDVVGIRFVGAQAGTTFAVAEQLPGVVNVYRGADPQKWRHGLPTYGAVVYQHLYPGIDLRYDGSEGLLKGTYQVAAGVDPMQIGWRYTGTSSVLLDEATGDLRLTLASGATLVEKAPVAYQLDGAQRHEVAVRYRLAGDEIGFTVRDYDPTRLLIIDPTLVYSSYLGGNNTDRAADVAVDTGEIQSTSWPVVEPVQATCDLYSDGNCTVDAFVIELSAAGDEILFNTYLGGGGNGGSGKDIGRSIAVDANGNLAITGETFADDFPTANAVQPQRAGATTMSDAFVTRLQRAGVGYQIAFSTYLGGDGTETGYAVQVGRRGELYAAGLTGSRNFPVRDALQSTFGPGLCFTGSTSRNCYDVFVAQFGADGSLPFSTYWGGLDDDGARGMALDRDGNLYVTGFADSAVFPVTEGALQPVRGQYGEAFVLKLGAVAAPPPPTATPTTTPTDIAPTVTPQATLTPTATSAPPTTTLIPGQGETYQVYLPAVSR